MLVSTLGDAAPALAQNPNPRDHRNGGPPAARIQVILNSVKVFDDREGRFSGDGEMYLWFNLICYETTTPCLHATGLGAYDGHEWKFSAGTGDLKQFDTVLPDGPSFVRDYDGSAEGGYTLRAGHDYHLSFGMEERDSITDSEQMGRARLVLKAQEGWNLGTHTIRSSRHDESPGDYELTFEVRKLVAPDLQPVDVKVLDLPGSTKKRVCTTVRNIDVGEAGEFEVALGVDDKWISDGRATAPGMAALSSTEVCGEAELPTSGTFKLTASVDGLNRLIEFNETNNTYDITHTAQQQPAAPSKPTTPVNSAASTLPAPGQGAAQADLTVSGIKVNGRAPDGKDDCKDGKNAVTVVVKNAGTAKADSFAVRLAVDGGDAIEETVDGLEAGKEREVKLNDVRLNKGEHALTATADAKGTVAEANEENNERKVTARCGEAA
jgi:hypothetical protein